MKNIIKNVFLAIFGNGVTLLSSTLTLMLIPKFLSVSDYGYMQMYIFYAGYLGLFNIGWIEGIYLKLGGSRFSQLDSSHLQNHYSLFSKFTTISSFICVVLAMLFVDPWEKKFIFIMVSFCLIPYSRRIFWDNVLLLSGEMKFFTRSCLADRAGYFLIILVLLFCGNRNVVFFIAADVAGKFLGYLMSRNACKMIWTNKTMRKYNTDIKNEVHEYIKSGINLLIGNLSSMLIIGTFRMSIEYGWNIETYSQMSLTLNLSNFILGFITAVSQVFFTLLKRSSEEKQLALYSKIRLTLTVFTLGCCLLYVPLKEVLIFLLPKYEFGLKFMAVLLPICYIECKWSFLTLTYLKAVREEKVILKVNVISLVLATVLSLLTIFILRDLFLAVTSIVVVLFIRGAVGEIILSNKLNLNFNRKILKEGMVVFSFIVVNWYLESKYAILIYFVIFLVFLISEKNGIIDLLKSIFKKNQFTV